jgi:Family of unknown function (DUF6328)
MPEETREERINRELIELLNELRVTLPGVQVLFAFLLAVPFANGWQRVTDVQKDAYMVALLAALAGSVFLIAPSAWHRILFRKRDKEQLLLTANAFAIIGTFFVAVGMSASVFLVTDVIYDDLAASVVAALTALLFAVVWFVAPLLRRAAA